MCDRNIKVAITAGIVLLAIFHAGLVIVGERVAPRLEQKFGFTEPSQNQFGSAALDFDKLYGANQLPYSTLPANRSAQSEVKQQAYTTQYHSPNCPCPNRPMVPNVVPNVNPSTPTYTNVRVTPVKTEPRESIALFVGSDAQSQKLLDWFNRDPELVALKGRCNFQVYTASNALYQTRYRHVVPMDAFPAMLFSDPNGGHIHAVFRDMLPDLPATLYGDMRQAFNLQKQVVSARPVNAIPISQTPAPIGINDIRPLVQASEADCVDGSCGTDRRPAMPLFDRERPSNDNLDTQIQKMFGNKSPDALLILLAIGAIGFLVYRRLKT